MLFSKSYVAVAVQCNELPFGVTNIALRGCIVIFYGIFHGKLYDTIIKDQFILLVVDHYIICTHVYEYVCINICVHVQVPIYC